MMADIAEDDKRKEYGKVFDMTNMPVDVQFVAFEIETDGPIGKEANKLLKQLAGANNLALQRMRQIISVAIHKCGASKLSKANAFHSVSNLNAQEGTLEGSRRTRGSQVITQSQFDDNIISHSPHLPQTQSSSYSSTPL
jgi:hypothetical protein